MFAITIRFEEKPGKMLDTRIAETEDKPTGIETAHADWTRIAIEVLMDEIALRGKNGFIWTKEGVQEETRRIARQNLDYLDELIRKRARD
jgi:hypothetical protein